MAERRDGYSIYIYTARILYPVYDTLKGVSINAGFSDAIFAFQFVMSPFVILFRDRGPGLSDTYL